MSMEDENKSKEDLIHELKSLRQQVVQLKERESLNDLARKALSKSVETFRGLFEQASDSIFLLELKGDEGPIIADANIAACRAHGYPKSELLEQPIRMLDSAETASHIDERTKRIARGEKLTFEGEHIRKDGTVFPVEGSTDHNCREAVHPGNGSGHN
jgi:PAS domain S-box-containing protein